MPAGRTRLAARARRPMTRRRTYKRRAMKSRVYRNVANNVHTFKRKAIFTYTPTTNTYFDKSVMKLTDIPGYTDFSGLFDRFKILKVVTKFYLRTGPDAQNLNNGNNAWYPKLYIVRDRDDDSAFTQLSDMRQRSDCRIIVFNPVKPMTFTCVPNILTVQYESATASAYTPAYKKWIDFDDVATPHFAWKWAITDIPSTAGNTSPYSFDVEHTYYFQCKDVL